MGLRQSFENDTSRQDASEHKPLPVELQQIVLSYIDYSETPITIFKNTKRLKQFPVEAAKCGKVISGTITGGATGLAAGVVTGTVAGITALILAPAVICYFTAQGLVIGMGIGTGETNEYWSKYGDWSNFFGAPGVVIGGVLGTAATIPAAIITIPTDLVIHFIKMREKGHDQQNIEDVNFASFFLDLNQLPIPDNDKVVHNKEEKPNQVGFHFFKSKKNHSESELTQQNTHRSCAALAPRNEDERLQSAVDSSVASAFKPKATYR